MTKKKAFLYFFLLLLGSGIVYLYIWEKPKLEVMVEKYVESLSKDDSIPFEIDISRTHFSIIPFQVELYDTEFKPKAELKKNVKDFKIKKMAVRPSLIDLLIGKFWISLLEIEGSELDIKVPKSMVSTDEAEAHFDFNKILKRIPLSELSLREFKLSLNYGNQYYATTDSLYIKAFNEKSSLILTIKDPNLGLRTSPKGENLNFLADFQFMITSNTISISKIKIVKATSYFLASGNVLYLGDPRNYTELNVKTRLSSNFADLHLWSNIVHRNDWLGLLKGKVKTDLQVSKGRKDTSLATNVTADLRDLQVENIMLGDFEVQAAVPDTQHINIKSIRGKLVGENNIQIEDTKIWLDETLKFTSNVSVNDAQLHSFLKESTIADIPVWLLVSGQLQCTGTYKESLKINCPGAVTATNLLIKNGNRKRTIIAAKRFDIAGSMEITESRISYNANAKMANSTGESTGFIDYQKGFEIAYTSDLVDFAEIGPISDLKFNGQGSLKGSTKGNSDYATFAMDASAENFEFEDYFFGELSTHLSYKAGTLYFNKLKGGLESTRYNGKLQVDLNKENISGDVQFPFFRMNDVQQAIIKKVDLENRFLGSGSARLRLDTPFEISQLNFTLDARLFKGKAFGEDYNEARLQAQSVDGIIIVQRGSLQKEQTQFEIRGTIDTELVSELQFSVAEGFLQHSSLLKEYKLPVSGTFTANGRIFGPLGSPFIKASSQIDDLYFNQNKYGDALFSFDNSNKQTNLQFTLPNQLELLLLFPESSFESVFVDFNSTNLNIAPLLGHLVSEEATRSYIIPLSAELSGKFDTTDFWSSEFSSTIQKITFDYKSNTIATTIPANVELKNGSLFLNEISLIGDKQFIKVTQPYTEKFRTKFIINSRMNISFFKLFAPFIEKIDGYSTMRLELDINHKDFKLIGSSYTTDSFIKLPGFPHAFEDLTADILFNQNKVLINSISGQMAGGTVLGNGEIQFPGNRKFDLLINTNLENINIEFPEGFKSSGNAAISLSGQEPPFLLSGHYDVYSGLIESNFDSGGSGESSDLLEELLKKEMTSPLLLSLDIATKNRIEVRNTLVEGYILGNLKVFDKINSPRIKGEVHFDKNSIIRFQDQEFEVTSSSFEFEGQTPINPKLSLSSKTRMRGYDIELFLQGRASKPILRMNSQPPLPENQIISMLALGQIPDQLDQTQSGALNMNSGLNTSLDSSLTTATGNTNGFEVGTSLLSNNPLAKEIKEQAGLDVQVSSSFDDQTGGAVPRVTVRKKITNKLQVSGSSTTGNTNQYEGRMTYELNHNLSTIFRVTNLKQDTNDINNTNPTRQANPFGVDLEYKVEFD